jgi:hypothetical protein
MDQVLDLAQQIRAKRDEIQKIAAKHERGTCAFLDRWQEATPKRRVMSISSSTQVP